MTERELLALAAKAIGIALDFDYPQREGHEMYFGPRLPMQQGVLMAATYTYWNPLKDDGDAFRLAVSLELPFRKTFNGTFETGNDKSGYPIWEDRGNDACAAARRAIVRAAAEIGRGMK